MASKEIQDQVKHKLFETWMPDKPGGLKGLINTAADAALAVLGERVEFLEGELEAAILESALTNYEPDADLEPDDDSDDAGENLCDSRNLPYGLTCKWEPNHDGDHCAHDREGKSIYWSDDPPEIDQTKYLCPQCGVTHQRDCGVGARHAHLFYGGQPVIVHLEHCPVLKDEEADCNCNAVLPSGAQRAQERRETS